jgi:DNA repair exonuclease SbcCD ATPase subunit
MELELCGFKCYEKVTYKIEHAGTHLIKGQSGTGKSTIFQAIYWVLYGSFQRIYNNTASKTQKCFVRLTFPNLEIYRQKRPELLRVIYNGKTTEDDVAQEIINNTFGVRDVWKSCCYIEQKDQCLLLTSNNSDKMDILNALSFNNDNPDVYIEKIDNRLTEKTNEYMILQEIFDLECKKFSEDIARDKVDKSLKRSTDQLDKLKDNLKLYELESTNLSVKLNEQQRLRGVFETLKLRSDKFMNEKSVLLEKMRGQRDQQQLEGELDNVKSMIINKSIRENNMNNVKKRDQIRETLRTFGTNDNIQRIDQSQLSQAYALEQEYLRNSRTCQSLGINYNQKDIELLKERINYQLTIQPQLLLHEQINQMKKKLNDFNSIPASVSQDSIDQMQYQITVLQNSQDIIKCPRCNSSLRYVKGQLSNSDQMPVTSQDINNAIDDLTKLKYDKYLYDQYQITLTTLKQLEDRYISSYGPSSFEIKEKSLDQAALYQLHRTLDMLNTKVIEFPDYQRLERNYQYQTLKDQEQELTRIILDQPQADVDMSETNLESIKLKLQYELNELRSCRQHLDYLCTQIDETSGLLTDVTQKLDLSIEGQIEVNMRSQVETRLIIDTNKLIENFQQRQVHLTETRNRLVVLYQEMIGLKDLKQLALEVECNALQETVDSINLCISDIVSYLFDDPMTIRLSLFKTVKKDKKMKPTVNFEISYKGGTYDSLRDLSGGEQDRISIAVTLALSRLSNCKILIFDETMDSLNAQIKDQCLKQIRKNIDPDRIVFFVAPDGIEGCFDNVINVT